MTDHPDSDPDLPVQEAQDLDADATHALGHLEKHHVNLRWVAIAVAVSIIIGLSVLEFYILCKIDSYDSIDSLFIFLAVSPIVSVTTILVFLLIGVFKSSQEAKLDGSKLLQLLRLSGTGSVN